MKFYNYSFTINNYTDEHIKMLKEHTCRAIGYGKEVGASGTPHLQGWVCYKNQRQERAVRKKLKGAHVEGARCIHKLIEYCKKEGDYTERGDIPMTHKEKGDSERARWEETRTLAKAGKLDDIDPDIYVRLYGTLKRIAADHTSPPESVDHLDNHWYWGPSGTGKSRKARTENPGAYIKLNNKWWDGYKGEDTVIMEDLDVYDKALGGDIKRWADHYPFPAEVKGSVKVIRPKKLIITSNYPPEEIWEDERTIGPIRRRFHVTNFTPMKKTM